MDRPGAGQAVTPARRGGRWGPHGAAAGHPLLLPLLPGLPGGRGGLPGDCAVARGDARAHAHCAPALQGARPRLLEPGLRRAPPSPPPPLTPRSSAAQRPARPAAPPSSLPGADHPTPTDSARRACDSALPPLPASLAECRRGSQEDGKGRCSRETGCLLKGSGVSAWLGGRWPQQSWDSTSPVCAAPHTDSVVP